MNDKQRSELIVLRSEIWLKSYEASIVAKREQVGVHNAQKEEFNMRMKLRDALRLETES